jgi:hypothetical protein
MHRASAAVIAALAFFAGAPAVAEPSRTGAETDEATASAKLMQLLAQVSANLKDSKYSHATKVNEAEGRYEFDCSGMAAWMLRRSAPKAHGAVVWRAKSGRPLARDYYYQIAASKPDKTHYGWRRVSQVAGARAGDVIAWLKPQKLKSPNTGHVAFLVEPPRRIPGHDHAYLLRIADASRYQHQDDTRTETGLTGFGVGTILVLADPATGAPMAYGWVGTRSAWVFATRMAIGRVEA